MSTYIDPRRGSGKPAWTKGGTATPRCRSCESKPRSHTTANATGDSGEWCGLNLEAISRYLPVPTMTTASGRPSTWKPSTWHSPGPMMTTASGQPAVNRQPGYRCGRRGGDCQDIAKTQPGNLRATARTLPGHCQDIARTPPGHCQDTRTCLELSLMVITYMFVMWHGSMDKKAIDLIHILEFWACGD